MKDKCSLFDQSIVGVMMPLRMIANESEAILKEILERDFAISLSDFNVMIPIDMVTHCTQADVARFNQISEAAVSKRIVHLEDAGLVERQIVAEDLRSTELVLTSKGKELKHAVLEKITTEMEDIFSDFAESDRQAVKRLLLKMFPLIIARSPRQDMFQKSQHPVVMRLLGDDA